MRHIPSDSLVGDQPEPLSWRKSKIAVFGAVLLGGSALFGLMALGTYLALGLVFSAK